MDTAILVAVIKGAAKILAGLIAILPRVLRKGPMNPSSCSPSPDQDSINPPVARVVYYRGAQYRFLNFGGRNCRIEPVNNGKSFLVPTHELFHDPKQMQRITRDSIVVRR